jgi:prepilin-type N-terminal cleavage/methylation domain-containing protein
MEEQIMMGLISNPGFVKNRKGDAGFTLIELFVVMSIMAVTAAIAIPAFAVWLPNYRLKSAARDVYSNLQLAKLGAVKENKDWAVVFDQSVTPGRYYIVSDDGDNNTWDGPPPGGDDPVENVEKTVDLVNYEGIDFGHGTAGSGIGSHVWSGGDEVTYAPDVVVFNSRGTCGSGYVYLANQKNTTYGIGTRASGVILLRKWSGSAWE